MDKKELWHGYDRARALGEDFGPEIGLLVATHKGLPQEVHTLLTLVWAWRARLEDFQAHCQTMADDASLDVFWRALAAEHLAGSTKETEVQLRMTRNHAARELAEGLDHESEDFLYLWYTLRIGCNETGDRFQRERYREAMLWMVAHGVRHAPKRVVEYASLVPEERDEMLRLVHERTKQPGCNFTRAQLEPVYRALAG